MFEYVHGARRQKEDFSRSTVFSVLVHLGLIMLLLWGTRRDMATVFAGGPGPGDAFGTGPTDGPAGGGGGGNENVTFFEVPAPDVGAEAEAETEAEVPEPEPEPEPDPEVPTFVVPEPPEVVVPPPSGALAAGPPAVNPAPASGAGTGAGPGTGIGTGPGADGGSGGGTGGGIGSGQGPGTGGGGGGTGSIRPPIPVSVFLPPPAPSSLRGRKVDLRLSVDERGMVREVDILTSTGDRSFENRLRQTAMEWRFQPARNPQNVPVAAVVPISFTF